MIRTRARGGTSSLQTASSRSGPQPWSISSIVRDQGLRDRCLATPVAIRRADPASECATSMVAAGPGLRGRRRCLYRGGAPNQRRAPPRPKRAADHRRSRSDCAAGDDRSFIPRKQFRGGERHGRRSPPGSDWQRRMDWNWGDYLAGGRHRRRRSCRSRRRRDTERLSAKHRRRKPCPPH